MNQIARTWLLAAAGLLAASAQASSHAPATPPLQAYTQECGACHLAYPSGMLPAASWARIMAGLNQHYGVNASLDAATAKPIAAWLQATAVTYKRVGTSAPPQDRISQSDWFARKHREVGAEVWKRPAVSSRANCGACHPGAAQADFEEDRVRMPR